MSARSLVVAAALVRQTQRIPANELDAFIEAERHQDVADEKHSDVGSTFVGVQLYDAAQQNGRGDVWNTVAPAPCQGRKGDSARPAVAAGDDAGRLSRCTKRATENADLNRCWRSIDFHVECTFNKAKHAPLVCILLVPRPRLALPVDAFGVVLEPYGTRIEAVTPEKDGRGILNLAVYVF